MARLCKKAERLIPPAVRRGRPYLCGTAGLGGKTNVPGVCEKSGHTP